MNLRNPASIRQSLVDQVAAIPSIARGQVWCHACGHTQKIDGVAATFGGGWPKHCGQTMSIDSPEERAAQKAKEST